MTYTVFHLKGWNETPSFDLLVLESEAELERHLQAAFAEGRACRALEVWKGGAPLFTRERPQG